jgi:threonyl-tRNA synthetase
VSLSDAPSVYAFEKSKNDPSLATKRHSLAHILAMAVQKIIPDAQATIGPCIENG